jgi:hypothetical protein
MRRRLVLFVEGEGDAAAVPVLAKRILKEIAPWEYLCVHDQVFKVGDVRGITGRKAHEWTRFLAAAAKLRDIGGVLLLLDGDCERIANPDGTGQEEFCAATVARGLAVKAREAGAGARFSVACVFACREFESWLLAGAESLIGKTLPDGTPGVDANAPAIEKDTEREPRGAKGWLNAHMAGGYKPAVHQRALTELVSLEALRKRNPRSFQRLVHAVQELCEAIRTESHIATPAPPLA